ncbi:LAMI_0D10770g1_1 [Lachancea mirantina]|uniref:LAMI_0D10770g1_1 n=1 Tax=Lachancea mirantina TaxID=1230905 RepID=A0A1G4JEH2_9SACH|nr:LAMI_0D10770g1_1 [Lachancea mirantina]
MTEAVSQLQEISIPHNDKDLSTYSKVLAIYTRNREDYSLYAIKDKQKAVFSQEWASFVEVLRAVPHREVEKSGITEYLIEAPAAEKFSGINGLPIKVSEYRRKDETQLRGIITTIEHENEFNDWLVAHILESARLHDDETAKMPSSIPFDELFTDYFAQNLKNSVANDKWENGGRHNFINSVRYFTDRNLRIECIMPAFPCKSSNMEKVHGAVPDKGEELALKRLIKATQEVQNFYPPGMKVWIVSDGHVFSDCIGVDDDVVDSYTAKLHELYRKISIPGVDAVGFAGLKELFFNDSITNSTLYEDMVEDVELPHYTGSKICDLSELSRKVLMKGFDTDDGRLRRQILIPNHPRLQLFRGFSRFMMDDLCHLSHFKGMSKRCFKKVVSKVAFEMIKRNDAYSNLVEVIFPHHVRLSIHAHVNSGPKYGVRLISSDQCRIVRSLDDSEEPKFEDLLHIPTPWHNCVIKIEGDKRYYLAKSKLVTDAIATGLYQGIWNEADGVVDAGGYYSIKRTFSKQRLM